MALVEVYRELEKATRVANNMVVSNKQAHKQAKKATDLWHASENRLIELGQWLKESGKTNLLALPPLASNHVDVSTQTEGTTNSVLATETAKVPPPNYEEELAAQSAITKKANE